MSKTIAELIVCARREVGMRRGVYPRYVRQTTMTQAQADHEIECMEQIVEVLRTLAAKEASNEGIQKLDNGGC